MTTSLRGRLLAVAALLIAIAIAIAGVALWFGLDRFVRGQIDGRLDAQTAAIATALEARDRPRLPPGSFEGPPFDRPGSGWYWEVRSPDGVLRSRSLEGGSVHLDTSRLPRGKGRPRPAEATGPRGETLWARVRDAGDGRSIIATAPVSAIRGPLREAMAIVGLTLLALLVLLSAAVLLQIRLGLRPLKRLQGALADIAAGRAERVATPQPAELRPLVAELNGLLDRQDQGLRQARTRWANVAHGLKTPLATLAVALASEGRDPDGRLRHQVELMDRRIRHHLRRARAAALDGPVRSATPIMPRVSDLLHALRAIYADRRLDVHVEGPADIVAACDAEDVDEMLGNVLDNAFKWARGRIRVEVARQERETVVVVEDDGPGLDAEAAAAALLPGRRLDESVPGSGFGLPITRELAELYGGALAIGRSALGGVRAVLTLPAVPRS